jgi:hypothetical protein
VPSPLEKSVVVVAVNGVEAKALVKGFGFDVGADGVSHGGVLADQDEAISDVHSPRSTRKGAA